MKNSRKFSKEKIITIAVAFVVFLSLGYGIYAVIDFSGKPDTAKNNIVNLNETQENVAINTQEKESATQEPSVEDLSVSDDKKQSGHITQQTEAMGAIDVTDAADTVDTDGEAKVDPLSNYSFSEESSLIWPVKGDIVLKYSMDSTIYFNSLGVYKCNPAISIASQEGTGVEAAADGIVESVTKNEETGNTVSIAIGDGYVTTYGLMQDIEVKEGDAVKKGQILGTVAAPTAYYAKEGANLYFSMTKQDEPVDPTVFFED